MTYFSDLGDARASIIRLRLKVEKLERLVARLKFHQRGLLKERGQMQSKIKSLEEKRDGHR